MQSIQTSSRRQFIGSTLGAAGLAALPTWAKPIGANEDIRVAVIGFNGRGGGHISSLLAIKGVRIVALCDVDDKVMAKQVAAFKKKNIEVKQYKDFRECCADKDIDAITIATPNHSHTLIAMTGLANGKHVYVEKPVCHNPGEGRQLVDAGAKCPNLILQHGMQRRSDLGWASVREFLDSGAFGKITLSRGLNYKMRASIGKVAAPTQPDANGRIAGTFRDTGGKPQIVDVDYKLWSAPREMAPMQREQFHYDWHWQNAYGNGDIGNQGPHQLDVGRWMLGNPGLPKRVMSLGGRWGYQDDGQTANNQLAFYDFESGAPLLFDNRGMPRSGLKWTKGFEPAYGSTGLKIANVVHCEGGMVAESKALDNDGKLVKKFEILDGPDHMKNFIASIRAGKLVNENLHISHGYNAAVLAQLGNVSYQLGKKMSNDEIKERLSSDKAGLETFENFVANLEANTIDLKAEQVTVGPTLGFDPQTEKFTGEFAAEANKLIEGQYAAGFELPKIG
jgi:hypothetical protein